MDPQGIAEIVIALPTVGVLLAAAFRFAVKLSLIYKEVTPNGGGSLKDRVMKVEGDQRIENETLKRHGEMLEDQTDRLDRIENMLKRLPCERGADPDCQRRH